MDTYSWMTAEDVRIFKTQAQKAVKERNRWEKEQLAQGKKKIMIPHPLIKNTYIIKFE